MAPYRESWRKARTTNWVPLTVGQGKNWIPLTVERGARKELGPPNRGPLATPIPSKCPLLNFLPPPERICI